MDAVEDTFARPLLVARVVCALVVGATLLLWFVAWLASRVAPTDWTDAAEALPVLSGLAVLIVVWSVVLREIGARLFVEPWFYSVATCLAFATSFAACTEGFILSIMSHSVWPVVGFSTVVYAAWALMWPRRGVWTRWQSRRQAALARAQVAK